MTKINVPLKVYSKWMWMALFTGFLSYIIILIRTDVITSSLVAISISSFLIAGWRVGKEATIYKHSIEVK